MEEILWKILERDSLLGKEFISFPFLNRAHSQKSSLKKTLETNIRCVINDSCESSHVTQRMSKCSIKMPIAHRYLSHETFLRSKNRTHRLM